MTIFVVLLVLALAREGSADPIGDVCANCEFVNGVGYVPGANCRFFYQCVQNPDGTLGQKALCCPDRTTWDQGHLACIFGKCNVSSDDCPEDAGFVEGDCPFWTGNVSTEYLVLRTGEVMTCADATVFSQEECACVAGGVKTCRDDALMYFPFAHHFNDVMCHKVQGFPHGDAHLVIEEGHVALDGDGDFISFGFLNNWFAWKDTTDLTISLFFRQTQAGWDNINNSPIEGLFGNGNCYQEASVWFTMGNETQQGGVRTDQGEAVFENGGADQADRWYVAPDIWCQMAIRYTKTEVTMFLNGVVTGTRSISGTLQNTLASATFGLVYFDCEPFFWTGDLDDLMIIDRYVSNDEMDYIMSLKTFEWADAPYDYFNL